jgi:hypothetical protein
MINQNHYENELDMPLGLSMALSQNPYLLGMFTSLSPSQREGLVGTARNPHENRSGEISGDMLFGAYRGLDLNRRCD